jgi:hypothetical protein
MLDVLESHIETKPQVCVVSQWISSLSQKEQEAFAKIKENNKKIQFVSLLEDLSAQAELPFKITAFRGHFRGYCSCQK